MDKKYPKRFHDQLRIEIATSQIQHDLRKLLPSLAEKDWKKIDQDISEWFLGEKFELEPLHDFWNIFGGFARGLKLKSLLFWVTAENVDWSKEEIIVDDIVVTWDFPGLEFMGVAPYRAKDIKKRLNEKKNEEIKNKLIQDSLCRSKKYVDRDRFRIILFYDPYGGVINTQKGFYVLEGNRRTIRAIVTGQKKIAAYVGRLKPEELWPKDYWFNTGTMRDLIFIALGYKKENDQGSYEFVRKYYQLLLRDFEIVRIATIDKSFKNFEKDEKLLIDLITKDLK